MPKTQDLIYGSTVTGRFSNGGPEPQFTRSHRKDAPGIPFAEIDFSDIERRVMSHYGSFGALRVNVVHPPGLRRRSWKARLFSRPWRPWQATEEGPQHPLWGLLSEDQAYRVGDTIYVSPAGYAALKSATKLAPLQE